MLDGSGPATLTPPSLDLWPKLELDFSTSKRVDVDTLTREGLAAFKAGDRLLLSGKILTGRDAAHKRLTEMMARGEKLPVDFTNRFIYYVGPVDPVRDEVVGPAGPTTSSRMDRFVEPMLAQAGLIGMIGKSERGPAAIESIKRHGALYCIAVGGAAYLVAKSIRSAKVLAFPELGMEAIYEFEVKDMPVTVAVDPTGQSVHKTGPRRMADEDREDPGRDRLNPAAGSPRRRRSGGGRRRGSAAPGARATDGHRGGRDGTVYAARFPAMTSTAPARPLR